MKIKNILILMMVVAMGGAAFGAGINVHLTGTSGSGYGYNHNGTGDSNKLTTASVVQWILGNPGAPNPANAGYLNSGTLSTTFSGNIGDGTGSLPGTLDKNSSASTASYLRVWENGGPATGSYYRTLGAYSVGDPLPTENYIASFQTNYLADVPPAPTVAPSGYKLTWSSTLSQYLVEFVLSATPASSPLVEVVSYTIAVKKVADEWSAGKTNTGGASWTITETNPSAPYFVAGQTYIAQAAASNYFGAGPYSAPVTFTIPGGGVGTTTFTFNLLGVDPTKLVINSIASPVATNTDTLKAKINTTAGAGVVVAISKWDVATGTSLTAGYDSSGTLLEGTANFDIAPGEGVQVFTTVPVTIIL